MKIKGKIAIILGASGLTGGILLRALLEDERYDTVKVFARKNLGFEHSKLRQFIGNLLELRSFEKDFKGDEVFCCIGTTKAKTPDKKQYHAIDFGIPVTSASLGKKNKIDTFIVISALGADANSRIFYNKTKGGMEEAVLNMKIPHTFILQPSLIGGKRQEKRLGEWLGKQFMKIFNLFLTGAAAKYKSIAPETIAKTMIYLANNAHKPARVTSDQIKVLAKKLQIYDRNRT